MDLTTLIARLPQPDRNNTILSFEKGQVVSRTHADVYADVKKTAEKLTAWGVKPGMRVGILAPNSYEWMIHDLALIELRTVSVAFSEDFKGASASALCDKYALSLLLSHTHASIAGSEGVPTAFLLDGNHSNGYTVGAGVEYMFAPNWSAKAEYQYYDFGSTRFVTPVVLAPFGAWNNDVHTFKVGVNYRFNFASPVVARY